MSTTHRFIDNDDQSKSDLTNKQPISRLKLRELGTELPNSIIYCSAHSVKLRTH